MASPPLNCVTGVPVDMDAVHRHWWHGHHHDPAAMQGYAVRGIVTAADYWEDVAARNADKPFVKSVETEESLTYGEVDRRANAVAAWAQAQGLRQGDVVALMMENQPAFLWTWIGLAKVGITIACINTSVTDALLRHAVEVAAAAHTIVSAQCAPLWRAGHVAGVTTWLAPSQSLHGAATPQGAERDWAAAVAELEAGACAPDRALRDRVTALDALFYIYTSGTTGRSKAARFSHRRFIGAGVTWCRHMELRPEDRYYVTLPLFHGNGGVVAVSAVLRAECGMVLRERFSATSFLADVRAFGCTAMIYIGELWRYVHNQPRAADDACNPLRVVAGNGLRADIWADVVRRFGIQKVVEHYGQTEMPSAHPMINSYNVVGSCGFIPNDVRGRLGTEKLVRYDVHNDCVHRDPAGRCVPAEVGEAGEAIVRLDGPYSGYTSAEATERVLYRDVFEAGDCWYHSGDLLRYDEWGFCYFVDRAGDSFRFKGENVSTHELCELLGRCAAVAEVNVYGVPVPGVDGKVCMASLLPAPGSDKAAMLRGLLQHAREVLPHYAHPRFLRLRSRENAKTGTLKFQKFRYVTQGFDPDRVHTADGEAGEEAGQDELWFLESLTAPAFVPLTREVHARILAGEYRF